MCSFLRSIQTCHNVAFFALDRLSCPVSIVLIRVFFVHVPYKKSRPLKIFESGVLIRLQALGRRSRYYQPWIYPANALPRTEACCSAFRTAFDSPFYTPRRRYRCESVILMIICSLTQ